MDLSFRKLSSHAGAGWCPVESEASTPNQQTFCHWKTLTGALKVEPFNGILKFKKIHRIRSEFWLQELVAAALCSAFPHEFQPSRSAERHHSKAHAIVPCRAELQHGKQWSERRMACSAYVVLLHQDPIRFLHHFVTHFGANMCQARAFNLRHSPMAVCGRTAVTTCFVGQQTRLATTSCKAW